MNMPEVTRCFGTFPPKYATYLIAVFGLASGLLGITGIILYGLIEKAFLQFLIGNQEKRMDESVRKVFLMAIGLTSLLLTVANTFLFLGATADSRGALAAGVWVIFGMCLLLIGLSIGAPVSCFFIETTCFVKKISTALMVISVLVITLFVELWLYFMVVANTYLVEIH